MTYEQVCAMQDLLYAEKLRNNALRVFGVSEDEPDVITLSDQDFSEFANRFGRIPEQTKSSVGERTYTWNSFTICGVGIKDKARWDDE